MISKHDNLITYIFFAVIITFGVHVLFKNRNSVHNDIEKFNHGHDTHQSTFNLEDNVSNNLDNNDTKSLYSNASYLTHVSNLSQESKFDPDYFKSHKKPIDNYTHDYLRKFLLGQRKKCDSCGEDSSCHCDKPVICKKEFNDRFFAFRDITSQNTDQYYDPVDKINNMKLGDGSGGQRIQDIYDNIVTGPVDRFNKDTGINRMPKFDNINFDAYGQDQIKKPMHLIREEWKYPNEKIINGGKIGCGLVGHDVSEGRDIGNDAGRGWGRGERSNRAVVHKEYSFEDLDQFSNNNWN
jgi:hypothetical protein